MEYSGTEGTIKVTLSQIRSSGGEISISLECEVIEVEIDEEVGTPYVKPMDKIKLHVDVVKAALEMGSK